MRFRVVDAFGEFVEFCIWQLDGVGLARRAERRDEREHPRRSVAVAFLLVLHHIDVAVEQLSPREAVAAHDDRKAFSDLLPVAFFVLSLEDRSGAADRVPTFCGYDDSLE